MEVFVLIKGAGDPRNIGVAARAIKTMGLSGLRLIDCCDHVCGSAKALAHGSDEILDQAAVYDGLDEASLDLDLLVGTTIRHRRNKMTYLSIRDLGATLAGKEELCQRVGVLFGGEKSGLASEDLYSCDIIATIPTAGAYPSLSLAQAVTIFAYELSKLTEIVTKDWRRDDSMSHGQDYLALRSQMGELLAKLEVPVNDPLYRQIIQGVGRLGRDDLLLMHAVRRKLMSRLEREESSHHD
jgi:tRNA/rRNA methyltransferase